MPQTRIKEALISKIRNQTLTDQQVLDAFHQAPEVFNVVVAASEDDEIGTAFRSLFNLDHIPETLNSLLNVNDTLSDDGGWEIIPHNQQDIELLNQSHANFERRAKGMFGSECYSVKQLATFLLEKRGFQYDSDDALRKKLKSTETMLRKMLSEQKLIGYKEGMGSNSNWLIPKYQVDKNTGTFISGIDQVCEIFQCANIGVHNFMIRAITELDNRTPIEALINGDLAAVLNAAKIYEDYQ